MNAEKKFCFSSPELIEDPNLDQYLPGASSHPLVGLNSEFKLLSGHSLYWYRQTVGKGPEFLVYFQNEDALDKSGMTNDRFSAERSEGTQSTLQIQRAEQGDSAVYLCASSPTTVGHRHRLALRKPRKKTRALSQKTHRPVLPGSARGTQLLCWVSLCLLGAGPAGAEVIQTPRHLIRGSGVKAVLKCEPVSGHSSVRWYQQTLGQGPKFLIEYYEQELRDKGDMPEGFSAQQLSNYSSQLDLSLLEPGDSALYLCASS
ncbi:uncharacterized protein LOC125080536 [Lutra lutra]|uniref:uncharacterized protein LOC125080536 n=1 Tax=Lutra lutra TaxID=9657 RepID=UPI001FD45E6D|nr:uncharacterized protein LOC125080536 [Lutra lutra]